MSNETNSFPSRSFSPEEVRSFLMELLYYKSLRLGEAYPEDLEMVEAICRQADEFAKNREPAPADGR